MSMTKKQAYKFKAKLDAGGWPSLPTCDRNGYALVLRMQPTQIAENIRHARAFQYGSGPLHYAQRLVQMGLFDKQWNLTNYGDSYASALENVKPAHK